MSDVRAVRRRRAARSRSWLSIKPQEGEKESGLAVEGGELPLLRISRG
jgi:hypothetical protein